MNYINFFIQKQITSMNDSPSISKIREDIEDRLKILVRNFSSDGITNEDLILIPVPEILPSCITDFLDAVDPDEIRYFHDVLQSNPEDELDIPTLSSFIATSNVDKDICEKIDAYFGIVRMKMKMS